MNNTLIILGVITTVSCGISGLVWCKLSLKRYMLKGFLTGMMWVIVPFFLSIFPLMALYTAGAEIDTHLKLLAIVLTGIMLVGGTILAGGMAQMVIDEPLWRNSTDSY